MEYSRLLFFFLFIFSSQAKFLRHDDSYTDDGINFWKQDLARPRTSDEILTQEHVLTFPRAENETTTEEYVLTLPRADLENPMKCVCEDKENTTGKFFDVTIVLYPNEKSK